MNAQQQKDTKMGTGDEEAGKQCRVWLERKQNRRITTKEREEVKDKEDVWVGEIFQVVSWFVWLIAGRSEAASPDSTPSFHLTACEPLQVQHLTVSPCTSLRAACPSAPSTSSSLQNSQSIFKWLLSLWPACKSSMELGHDPCYWLLGTQREESSGTSWATEFVAAVLWTPVVRGQVCRRVFETLNRSLCISFSN